MKPQSNLALLKEATRIGLHAQSSPIKLTFGLKLRNEAALHRFLQAVQDPRSPQYHKYLTPAEFTAEYGPSKSQVEALSAFLGHWGIQVTGVSPNRLLVHTSGATSAYEHALEIRIDDYSLNGRSFYSTENSPKLPAGVAPFVVNILGLNHGMQMRPMSHYEPLGAKGGVGSKVTAKVPTPPAATSAYFNPYQIATAYDWPSITEGNNGEGVSTAILTADSSGLATEDSPANFWSAYGLPDHTINVIPVDGDSGATDGMVETLLDMEWSGAMSPGEALNVYVAGNANLSTFADMYNQLVTDNTSQVMTTSWGIYESADPSLFQTDDQIFEEAAAQGISMFAAAGDNGSSDGAPSGDDNADYPSSSLYVTASNGTELTADVDGNYVSETAWSDTGGATSQLFAQPGWQTGPGVPDSGWRMNSDMAMNAGSLHPFLLYVDGQWGLVWGTSAVAPQFAGLFAIGVSQNGQVSLGQSNKLIYDDVNANNYASDFRDVTSGCNGAYCAGTDWDHPTGWGSPKATSLLSHLGIQGPRGTIAGTVTDAASGLAIAGAEVTTSPGVRHGSTDDQGRYSFDLPVGSYSVTVTDFGYQTGNATVNITDGNTTTQDFQLQPAATATLSGHVTDGSGHGYALYAEIKVTTPGFGQVADLWTNPKTGEYSVSLPKGYDYTLAVTPIFDGYNPGAATVTLSGDATQNFALTVLATCSAPGYHFTGGFGEDFNGSFPPSGWTVTNDYPGSDIVWRSNPDWHDKNYTPQSKPPDSDLAATADSNNAALYDGYYGLFDTSLISPPIAVTSLGSATLQYDASYWAIGDKLDLDISTDGGTTWATVLEWGSSLVHGALYGWPGEHETVDLSGYLPSSGTFQLRWRYYDLLYGYDLYAQIDNVLIGADCTPISGGLVYGQVTDANTGDGIVGAKVADDTGASTKTVTNPADQNLPVGVYEYFVLSGARTLTASHTAYSDATAQFTMNDNALVTQDFVLKAGRLSANPDHFTMHVMVNNTATAAFAISNTGDVTATFNILPIDSPPPGTSAADRRGAPLHTVKGHFSKASRMYVIAHGQTGRAVTRPSVTMEPHDAPWMNIADLPSVIEDNIAATDPTTGKVYSVYGFNGLADTGAGFVYDPIADSWSPIATAPNPREDPVGRFIKDRLYVAGGYSPSGKPTATLAIYDPGSDSWSTGTDDPNPVAGGAAGAVLNGKLYVVGGCTDSFCSSPAATVEAYDPGTDSWSAAAPYPVGVAFAQCGAINGKLYCAGGFAPYNAVTTGYAYDPSSDSWSPIADMPDALAGGGYSSTLNQLLISGGINGLGAITNEGYSYDPASDSWTALPNSNTPVFRGGSSCGFYLIGGEGEYYAPVAIGQILPGYTPCGKRPSIAWATVAPLSGTVVAGASTSVALSFDGTGQAEFTTSQAYLAVTNDTPYGTLDVPLTVTWDPQYIHLVITGTTNVNPVQKGNALIYTLTVENRQMTNHGAATETKVSYPLPAGVSYVASNGDANCTAPAAGSTSAPVAATAQPGTVVCDFGTVDLGASKTETITVQVADAGTLTSTFDVSAREPDSDPSTNTVSIDTTVTGTADLSASASDATIAPSSTGTIHMAVSNAGPDTATDVAFKVSSGADAKLLGATSSQGSCSLISGSNALSCSLGDVPSGQSVTIGVSAFGAYAGTATVQGQITTSSNDPDQSNNVTSATVTVKSSSSSGGSSGGGGGGALGWLALAALLGLALAGTWRRRG